MLIDLSELKIKVLTTVSVFTRHSDDCNSEDPQWKRCQCRKWLYIYHDGQADRISAKTRSWGDAERIAQEIRDDHDPVKLKQRQLDRLIEAKQAEAVKIDAAVDQWYASLKNHSDGTRSKYRTFADKLKRWAVEKQIVFVTDVTAAALDEWRGHWSLNARRDDDRMAESTQAEFQVRLKNFFGWAQRNKMIDHDPSFGLKTIKKNIEQTLPLTDEQFKELIQATYTFDDAQRRAGDRFGVDMRALFLLMRWTGLRIGDAAAVSRDSFNGNRLVVRTKKTGKLMTIVVPDIVINTLQELPRRAGIHPNHYFWSRQGRLVSLSCLWGRKIDRLNQFLSFTDENKRPMKFHSHMLRDTFAVNMLLSGVPLEDVSRMLGHSSVKVTERHYAPWVKARQRQLEDRMIAAFQLQGASVSLSA